MKTYNKREDADMAIADNWFRVVRNGTGMRGMENLIAECNHGHRFCENELRGKWAFFLNSSNVTYLFEDKADAAQFEIWFTPSQTSAS